MSGHILLGLWRDNKITRLRIDSFNLENDTKILRNEVSVRIGCPELGIELMYRGIIFEDGHSVSYYGVIPGSTVHVLEKRSTPKPPPGKQLTTNELKQLVLSFKTFKISRFSTTALQRICRPEALSTIMAATPGLADDPTALGVIQDWELLVTQMSEPEVVAQIAEKHPSLVEAAYYIATHVYEEQDDVTAEEATTSTDFVYSFDAFSDDEDDMELDVRDLEPTVSATNSDNAITAAQIAAAIANATSNVLGTSYNQPSNLPTNSAPVTGRRITEEAFSNALQEAFAFSSFGGNTSSQEPERLAGVNVGDELPTAASRWRLQLQQMREMGLSDDNVNIRALEATSGDIQAAVELVFSGIFNSQFL